jgi:hypothetical protein
VLDHQDLPRSNEPRRTTSNNTSAVDLGRRAEEEEEEMDLDFFVPESAPRNVESMDIDATAARCNAAVSAISASSWTREVFEVREIQNNELLEHKECAAQRPERKD